MFHERDLASEGAMAVRAEVQLLAGVGDVTIKQTLSRHCLKAVRTVWVALTLVQHVCLITVKQLA